MGRGVVKSWRADFNRVTVPLFSGLLLHDVGTGDGIAQGAALPEEIRTPALWGLRLRRPLVHDGSAATIEDALRGHWGEAELAVRGFAQLSPEEKARVLSFLRSLWHPRILSRQDAPAAVDRLRP